MANLPPIDKDQFDGVTESKKIEWQKQDLSKVFFDPIKRELRHPNGAAWSGPGLEQLLKAFRKASA